VKCDKYRMVYSLDLNWPGLSDVPSQLDLFAHLSQLRMQFNGLTSVPSWMGQMTGLTLFDLSCNSLRGNVAPWAMPLRNAGKFTSLQLRNNGCLTDTGEATNTWISALDPLWQNGCTPYV